MLLIFISWIYIVFSTINFGTILDNLLVLKNKNFVVTSLLGLFLITVIASIWAIFGRINIEFHAVLLLCNAIIFASCKKKIGTIYTVFWTTIWQLSKSLKLFLGIITVLIIAQCSLLPYVIDNESYYIQTIKWFNEYGFVKGLANLHLYLGQASGWHITQSVFNFSFLYENFNDLSGYCLLLGCLFSIEKLNAFFTNKKLTYLLIGVFPLASIYFFQFISAPSPDIPVYVLTFIILFYFIENFKNCTIEIFNLIVILVLFMLNIKSTSLVFVLIPILLLVQNQRVLLRKLLVSGLISFTILALFLIKNSIISGSLLFPSKLFESVAMDYSIPKTIERNYYDNITYFGYHVSRLEFETMSFYELFLNWLSMPKIHGLFNKICVLLLLISPIFIYKFQNKKTYWIAYTLMVVQFLLLLSTSPQYRFFMNFVLFFGFFCLISLLRNKNQITFLLLLSVVPIIFLLLKPVPFTTFTNNKFMQKNSTLSFSNVVFPLENTKMKTDFEVIELGNMKYNSPVKNDFFYGTGNGSLPCVNKTQVEYYHTNFNVIPQMRTNNLKDGFYAKKRASGK